MPATRVEGRTYIPATVEQRMREHGVPAVSIAVIDDGRIAWVRAYGLADVEEKWKATPQTLFQAASISKPVAAALTLETMTTIVAPAVTPTNEPRIVTRRTVSFSAAPSGSVSLPACHAGGRG